MLLLMALPMGVVHAVPEDEVQKWKDSYLCSREEPERIALGLVILTNAAMEFGDTEGKNPATELGAPPSFDQVYLNELVCQHSTGSSQNWGFFGGKMTGGNAQVVKELDKILEGDDDHKKRDAILKHTEILIQMMDIRKEIEDASKQLKESIKDNQGSMGLPIPGSINMSEVPEEGKHNRGDGEILENSLKNGATGVGIATKMDNGMVVTKDDGVSITEYISIVEFIATANGGTMYPGVIHPFTLLFTPTGTKEEIIEQVDVINDLANDMYTSIKHHTDEPGSINVAIRKPRSVDNWDDVVLHVNGMEERAITLTTTVDKMHGLEDGQNLYSISEVPVPRAFWTKDAANDWLRKNSIPEIDTGFEDYAAVKIRMSNKGDGYGLAIAEKVGELAQKKGLTTMATSLVDHKGATSDISDYFNDFLSTANYKAISRWVSVNVGSIAFTQGLRIGADNATLSLSRVGDAAFKGGFVLSNEDKKLLRQASDDALEEGMKQFSHLPEGQRGRAAQKYAIGYKNEVLKNLSGAKGIPTDFKGGATGHIRDSIGKAGQVSNEIVNSVKSWTISKTPIPRLQTSQMAKLAGHRAAQASMESIMARTAATKGAAMAVRTASAKMTALIGGPVGWAVFVGISAIDLYYNWEDYTELVKGIYRLSMEALGKNPYPDPTEEDEKVITWIAASYKNVGFLDLNPEKYADAVLSDQEWVAERMYPILEERRNYEEHPGGEFPEDDGSEPK